MPHRFWYSPSIWTRNASSADAADILKLSLLPTPGMRTKYMPAFVTEEKSISYVSSPAKGTPSLVFPSGTRSTGDSSRRRATLPEVASTSSHADIGFFGRQAPNAGPSHAPTYAYLGASGRYPT